ncbi:17162_t:CDS:2, partial [Dentiscutata erythropus]
SENMSTKTSKAIKTSQTTKTSKAPKVEAEVNAVWVLTTFFSRYKYDFEMEQIDQRCFASEELARTAMKITATKLYQSPLIQEAHDKYFEEYESEIHFGERPGESDYRREFGCCRVEFVEIEGKKR